MDLPAIDSILSQLRAAQSAASGRSGPGEAAQATVDGQGASFAESLKSSIAQVNGAQLKAQDMAQAYELGTGEISLHEVMVQMAKANISFQTMIQVRNRLVSAYHDMMNMQV